MKYKYVHGNDFGKELSSKLGLENARRIIIDCQMTNVVLIYVELIGDERLYNINMDKLPTEIEIIKE